MKSILVFLMTSLMLLTGCVKDKLPEPGEPPVLFQYEFINYAWVYHHQGFLIANDGTVFTYNLPESWKHPSVDGLLSGDDLEFNLNQSQSTHERVGRKPIKDYYGRIKNLKDSKIHESDVYMADAGTAAFYAWYPDGSENYQRVLIAQSGDVSMWSESQDMTLILEWLKNVGEQAGDFIWFPLD